MYGIYANMWGILMVNVTIYSSTMDPMGHLFESNLETQLSTSCVCTGRSVNPAESEWSAAFAAQTAKILALPVSAKCFISSFN